MCRERNSSARKKPRRGAWEEDSILLGQKERGRGAVAFGHDPERRFVREAGLSKLLRWSDQAKALEISSSFA